MALAPTCAVVYGFLKPSNGPPEPAMPDAPPDALPKQAVASKLLPVVLQDDGVTAIPAARTVFVFKIHWWTAFELDSATDCFVLSI